MMSFFFVKETQSCWSDPVHRGLKTRFFCRHFEVYSRERLRSFFPSKVSRYLMNRHHIISVPPRRTVSLWDSVLCLSQCPPYAVKDWWSSSRLCPLPPGWPQQAAVVRSVILDHHLSEVNTLILDGDLLLSVPKTATEIYFGSSEITFLSLHLFFLTLTHLV